ncbi:MAG: T9SS type A sorting domain-containing protein [bacterium]|nr:T9SS type A sorting domain-containing protein [bacterium]
MGDDADNGRAFQMSNSEIGADRKVLSTPSDQGFPTNGSFPNLFDVFEERSTGGSNPRWDTNADPNVVSVSGEGLVSPIESIDWSGEVALTSNGGRADLSNSLVFAETGIQGVVSNPLQGSSNSKYLNVGETSPGEASALALNNGATGNNNFSSLLSELGNWKSFIQGLSADKTITNLNAYQNNEANNGFIQGTSGNGLITTFGSSDDTNGDGIVIIDINPNDEFGDFNLTNLDWAIIVNDDVLPIFRLREGSNMIMNNVSILVNNGCCGDIRAIFYSGYEGDSGDTVFNGGSNVILNGIGLWDLNAVGEGGGDVKTNININNAQGCAQFISQKVNFQNNRWNRCNDDGTVANFLQFHESGWVDGGVELSWRLSEISPAFQFSLQRQMENGHFVTLDDAVLHENGMEFIFRDLTAEAGQEYIYRVVLDSETGPNVLFETMVTTLVGKFALHPNWPNPFNPSTKLAFELATPARVRLNIFDTAGRLVSTLLDEQRGAGRHELVWNGQNDAGQPVASGVYLYRFEAGDVVQTKRMMMLK